MRKALMFAATMRQSLRAQIQENSQRNCSFTAVGPSAFLKSLHSESALSAAELEGCDTQHTDVKEQYRVYLSAYRAALAESDVAKLETAWTEVDQTWMDIRHWVQV